MYHGREREGESVPQRQYVSVKTTKYVYRVNFCVYIFQFALSAWGVGTHTHTHTLSGLGQCHDNTPPVSFGYEITSLKRGYRSDSMFFITCTNRRTSPQSLFPRVQQPLCQLVQNDAPESGTYPTSAKQSMIVCP